MTSACLLFSLPVDYRKIILDCRRVMATEARNAFEFPRPLVIGGRDENENEKNVGAAS
jgi:hypothetical protein